MLEVMRKVNPIWDSATKTLYVEPTLSDDPHGIDLVKEVLLYGASWINFVDTRFGAIGPCGRAWIISESLGVASLADLTLQDPRVMQYYLHGCKKLDTRC